MYPIGSSVAHGRRGARNIRTGLDANKLEVVAEHGPILGHVLSIDALDVVKLLIYVSKV